MEDISGMTIGELDQLLLKLNDELEDVEEERILEIGHDHAQRAALPSRQRAGMKVGMILEFFDGFKDAGAGGVLDGPDVIDNARDGGDGNSGPLGNILQFHGRFDPFDAQYS